MTTTTQLKRERRIVRGRMPLHGTATRPRISVQRTAKHFRAQAIDDASARTLFAVADDQGKATKATGIEQAKLVGQLFAEAAKAAKIDTFIFDRRGYRYHGRVKAFADAVRDAGLKV